MKPSRCASLVGLPLLVCGLVSCMPREIRAQATPAAPRTCLFPFDDPDALRDWSAVTLPGVENEAPAPRIVLVRRHVPGGSEEYSLQITFEGGDWPAVGTTKIPVAGNWKAFQTLRARLTVDRTSVAYFRICQDKRDAQGKPPCWEKTMILQPGGNEVVLNIRRGGYTVINPDKGDISGFVIGMYRPEKGQGLQVGPVWLDPGFPPPETLGWYSPYNHDGYSAAVAREYARTGLLPRFPVLGTDLVVYDLRALAVLLKDRWTKPEPQTIEQVEGAFRAELARLRPAHPRAALAILRDGETGWDPAHPDKVFAGWKMVYTSSHGPDGPNRGREVTPKLGETVELFMRHRGVLMRVDLSSIPADSAILAAKLVITRGPGSRPAPEKPNMWAAEPCHRSWDETAANCYFYAPGKHWKAVNGLYYGEDPDFWPVYLAHGPAGGGDLTAWDFTEALRFWQDGTHPNQGFYLHGDSFDYMKMYTMLAKEVRQRPAVMVIYEPGS